MQNVFLWVRNQHFVNRNVKKKIRTDLKEKRNGVMRFFIHLQQYFILKSTVNNVGVEKKKIPKRSTLTTVVIYC